jgi:DNA-binding CsgD family transcriptional regulator
MIHLLLLSYALTVVLGTVSAVYASQAYRSLKLPYLRPVSLYAIIFLVSVFCGQILEYVYINIMGGDFRDIPIPVMIFWNIFLALAQLFMLYAIGRSLLRMKGPSARALFSAGFALVSILKLAPLALMLMPRSFFSGPPGPIVRLVPYAGNFLALAFIGGLSALKSPQNGQRSISVFGLCFTAWYAAQFAIQCALKPMAAYYANSVLLLPVSAIPFLWIRFGVLREIGRNRNEESRDHSGRMLKSFNISPREEEIIQLILQGMSNKEIQASLFISPSTVKNHVYNIYQKMNVKSRLQLVSVILNQTPSSSRAH